MKTTSNTICNLALRKTKFRNSMELYGRSDLDFLQSRNKIFKSRGDYGKTSCWADGLQSRKGIKQMIDS